jgi:tetratricopeptide (TPR) repeat protein
MADARPADGSMAGMAQVEHLLLEGEVRMTVSDYANAVKVYEKLVDLAPNIAQYRVRLAIAMAGYPRTAKQAEREFLDALRLEPNNADIHYQFGLYYKVMKQRARALAEMQTAVKLSPRHRMARAELETLSPKDSALVNLKKLFK